VTASLGRALAWARGVALLTCAACASELQAAGAVYAQERTVSTNTGFDVEADLGTGAFRVRGAPNVSVHAAPGFDARAPLQLVVFLHGYSACVRMLMGRGERRCRADDKQLREGWDLAQHHDDAGTNTLFIIPQLAYLKRDGSPGAFDKRGGFRAFLEELLAGPLAEKLGGPRSLRDVARIDLVAHSGGYHAALAILERGGVDRWLKSLVLFDALYGETPRFAGYVERHSQGRDPFRLIGISLPHGIPDRESGQLFQRLQHRLGSARVTSAEPAEIASRIRAYPIVIAHGTPPHSLVPATHLAQVLAALYRSSEQP